MVASILQALIGILEGDSDVTDLTGGTGSTSRIYAGEVPKSESANMPRQTAVISPSPASIPVGARDYVDINTQGFDLLNYGRGFGDCEQLQRATHTTLKAINRKIVNDMCVWSLHQTASPSYGRDRDTDWPFMIEGWTVQYAELTVE
mgnify:CR=1 FL=1